MTHRSQGNGTRPIRVLVLSDTHLGFDLPLRPRVERRRRGPDFFANFDRALEPALHGRVDLVIHTGDVFYRSRVRSNIVVMVLDRFRPLLERGVPVLITPGNHERSRLPFPLLWHHPCLHVFDGPRTVMLDVRGSTLAISGFPYYRGDLRSNFTRLLHATGWNRVRADARLLVLHHAIEGATVGPVGFTFRNGPDVVRGRDIPRDFAGVISGHIHRHQVLRTDLAGRPLGAPVFFPGSTERTSVAEKDEEKGYLLTDILPTSDQAGRIAGWRFVRLPTRPMVRLDFTLTGRSEESLRRELESKIRALHPESVVKVRLDGAWDAKATAVFRAEALRQVAPKSMSVDLRVVPGRVPQY